MIKLLNILGNHPAGGVAINAINGCDHQEAGVEGARVGGLITCLLCRSTVHRT